MRNPFDEPNPYPIPEYSELAAANPFRDAIELCQSAYTRENTNAAEDILRGIMNLFFCEIMTIGTADISDQWFPHVHTLVIIPISPDRDAIIENIEEL